MYVYDKWEFRSSIHLFLFFFAKVYNLSRNREYTYLCLYICIYGISSTIYIYVYIYSSYFMILVYMGICFSGCKFNFSIQLFTFSFCLLFAFCCCGLETTKKIYKLFKLMPSRKLSSSMFLKKVFFVFFFFSFH